MLFTNLQTKETYTAMPYKEVLGFAGAVHKLCRLKIGDF